MWRVVPIDSAYILLVKERKICQANVDRKITWYPNVPNSIHVENIFKGRLPRLIESFPTSLYRNKRNDILKSAKTYHSIYNTMEMVEVNDVEDGSNHSNSSRNFRVDQRLRLGWAWFVVTISTGGIAVLLSIQPFQFRGLQTIGKVVFILNLSLYIFITTLLIIHFKKNTKLFIKSLQDPGESLFIPTFLLTVATIIISMQSYGVPSSGTWLLDVIQILFWIYVGSSLISAVTQYFYLFTARQLLLQDMMPSWLLPIFPAMVVGTVAGTIAKTQSDPNAMSILVAGLTFQGLGFWASTPMYGVYMARLLQFGLPAPNARPGMFIAVGPPSFTGLALIKMSQSIPSSHEYFQLHPAAAESLKQSGLAFAIFLWSLALWFFAIALLSVLIDIRKMNFDLGWYASIFPNVGFTAVTITIGESLHSSPIKWLGSAMTICLVSTYLYIVVMHIRAITKGRVMWPWKE